jgi:hypothetical protein
MRDALVFSLIIQLLHEQPQQPNESYSINDIDALLFYQLLIRHRIWHQALSYLSKEQIILPTIISQRLAFKCKKDKQHVLLSASETARIAKCFEKKQITYCVVKGLILNTLLYDVIYARSCRDIDVWVEASQFDDAAAQLVTLGYEKQYPLYRLTGFKRRYYMTHKHDMAFYHPQKKMLIELHFRLGYFGVNFMPILPKMMTEILIFNTKVSTLHNDYHLLFLMIHGAIHAWMRLRWLYDIVLFIQQKQCDLQRVMTLSRRIGCEHIVQQSLMLSRDLLKCHDEAASRFIEKPSWRVRTLSRLAQDFIKSDYEPDDGVSNIKMFIKYRYYLLLCSVKGQKRRAIWHDLFKIERLFSSVTVPESLSFLYYFIYPGWVVLYIYQSIRKRMRITSI